MAPETRSITMRQLVRDIRMHQPAELALLLGAGASVSSGVPLARAMIDEWRQDLFEAKVPDAERARSSATQWLEANKAAYPWFKRDMEYSRLFELRYPNASTRQKYIEQKIEGVHPGWGYLYLANIIANARYFSTVFTTNFDDLLSEALGAFLRHNAVVCNADSEVDQISFLSERAKIIKLHGDYLFAGLRNTEEELRTLGKRMAAKFRELARQRGLVVVGYAGRDHSVMSMIETLLADGRSFPHSVYWGVRPGDDPSEWVARLAAEHSHRFTLFACDDFDRFMADLHASLGLELPDTITSPRVTLEAELAELVAKAGADASHELIREHSARLKAQLGRPVDAELALAKRDYQRAAELVRKQIEQQGRTGPTLTVLGQALAMQAEEEGNEARVHEAIAVLREAIAQAPDDLPQRYSLASLLIRRRMWADAITACEELSRRAPTDAGVRRYLVELYRQSSQFSDAETQLAWLEQREPTAADIPMMQAMLYLARGYTAQAADCFREAVKRDPRNPITYVQLAASLLAIREVDEAERTLEQAANLAPDNVMILMQLIDVYSMHRPGFDPVPLLDKAVRLDPNSVEARGRLGNAYLMQNRLADAERETLAGMRVTPNDARLLCNLGLIALFSNREAEALDHFEESRRLNPSLPITHSALALVHCVRGHDEEANQDLQALPPPMRQGLVTMAYALKAQAARGVAIEWRQVMQPMLGWQPEGAPPPAQPSAVPPAPATPAPARSGPLRFVRPGVMRTPGDGQS
jgi:tetratricopeptide (TPR) repeat protein